MPRRMRKPSLPATLGAAIAIIALAAGASVLHGAARFQPCASTEFTASVGDAAKGPGPERLTIVLTGDAGFNPKGASVEAEGFEKDGKRVTFTESLSGIAPDVDGDLAFVNLETVVTDRNDLVPDSRARNSPTTSRATRGR